MLDRETRKTMLYRSKVEYADYAMNHVRGCSHGCRYPCYAYLLARRTGRVSDMAQWTSPVLVDNALELLDAEIPRLRGKVGRVQLCFTTDPFMYGQDEVRELSLAAIARLNRAGIPCTVLTKGVLPPELADALPENEYGITLVSLDEGFRERFEPGAAPFSERIGALRRLHDAGCRTWVSIEPYPTPNIVEQELHDVLGSVSFANRIVFGRMNYSSVASSYPGASEWYAGRAAEVTAFCNANGISWHIKSGT